MQNLGRGSRRDRVAAKFVESEFEKIDRLMEIYTVMHCSTLLTERHDSLISTSTKEKPRSKS